MALKRTKGIERIVINMSSRFSGLDRRVFIILMGVIFLLLTWIIFIQVMNESHADKIVNALAVIDKNEDMPKKTFNFGVPIANGEEPNEE